jgi:iron complex outermembrane receptor protein
MKINSLLPNVSFRRGEQFLISILCFILVIAISYPAIAQVGKLNPEELKKLSLEELMNVEVTSVSKRAEKLAEAASAIQIITQKDIRNSGKNTP